MKNTSALTSQEYEEISISASSVEETEDAIIKEHLGQIKVEGLTPETELELVKNLMQALKDTKEEGERVQDFEERIKRSTTPILKIDN